MLNALYQQCKLCPRKCGVNRYEKTGFCKAYAMPKVGRAALHFWEEPCISGTNGSGTVFFSGCTLRCCYCQNYNLSRGNEGVVIDEKQLYKVFLKLQSEGAHNINLVTAEHYAPSVKVAVTEAKKEGLTIPVILNSSGYVSLDTLELLKDVIDIYLVDFKYMDSELSKMYSFAEDYPLITWKALEKMVKHKPKVIFDENGIMQSGVIVRHLCLPGHTKDSKKVIKQVFKKYKDSIVLSIMSQYTPMGKSKFENLDRKLSEEEYNDIIDYCINLGIEDAYIQEGEAASESFIPVFDGSH
ncbi:MAG: radical SAM protein [Clostridia bacterium]|nr:radical SAM protein [Clostridia bacterium]